MAHQSLERFFRPRSIAIIGASSEVNTLAGQPLKHLQDHGYTGNIYPVNPKYPELLGVKCYPSIESLPETPDMALVLVNASRVADMLRACGKRGVPFAVVFGSGYAETGEKGLGMQRELADIGREYDMGILGPNCQGMVNIADRVYATFGSVFDVEYPAGTVSMVSQSGGFGFSVVNLASTDLGLHFRQIATTGNEVGLTTLDFMDYFIDDPKTSVIVSYIEGLKDARRLVDIGTRALERKKPMILWKAGNSAPGQNAVASHTANLGGTTALYKAAFRQLGIIEIEDMQDLVDYCLAFECGKLPAGNRVAIVTVSGGSGILATDACAAGGMEVPPLAPATLDKLREFIPWFGSLKNPIDVTATIINDWNLVNRTLTTILNDPGIDAITMVNTSLKGDLASKVAREIVAVSKQTHKPIFVTWSARDAVVQDAYAILDAAKIPRYKSPVRCGRAIAMLSRYAESLRRHESRRSAVIPTISSPQSRKQLEGRREDLTEYAAKQVLAKYGIGITREELATSRDEAQAIARRIGYPVALKAQSPDIPHKTEAKVVRLNVRTDGELSEAYEQILRNARAYRPNARLEGVLVQEMAAGGIETILGVNNDRSFGPVVMFGLGGIFTEVLKDVSFRVAPLSKPMALEMIEDIKGYVLLSGARGAAAADIDALADAIVKLSALALDLKDLVGELDINPLFVFEKGKGVKAGDALIKPLLHSPQGT